MLDDKAALETMHTRGLLSKHSYVACRKAGIGYLSELRAVYETKGSFYHLLLGSRANSELVAICRKALSTSAVEPEAVVEETPTDDQSLVGMYRAGMLSESTYIACRRAGIGHLSELREVYETRGTFLHLKNIGGATNHMLLAICRKASSTLAVELEAAVEETVDSEAAVEETVIKDHSLAVIHRAGMLSARSYNACRYAGVGYVSELWEIYKQRRSFFHLNNIGKKSNSELVAICHKALSTSAVEPEAVVEETATDDQSLVGMYRAGMLSVRSYRACRRADIRYLAELRAIYETRGSFFHLNNIGKKSNSELVAICRKAGSTSPVESEAAVKGTVTEDHSLAVMHRAGMLSVRSYRACRKAGVGYLSELWEIYKQQGSFFHLDNIGKTSNSELVAVCLQAVSSSTVEPVAEQILHYSSEKRRFLFPIVLGRISLATSRTQKILRDNWGLTVNNAFWKNLSAFLKEKAFSTKVDGEAGSELMMLRYTLLNTLKGIREKGIDEVMSRTLASWLGLTLYNEQLLHKKIKSKTIALLEFVDSFVIPSDIMSNVEKDIFLKNCHYGLNRHKSVAKRFTHASIAERHGLSRERVRQIEKKFRSDSSSLFMPLLGLLMYSRDTKDFDWSASFWQIELPVQSGPELDHLFWSDGTLANILRLILPSNFSVISSTDHLGGHHAKGSRDYSELQVSFVFDSTLGTVDQVYYDLRGIAQTLGSRIGEDKEIALGQDSSEGYQSFIKSIVAANFSLERTADGVIVKRNAKLRTDETIAALLEHSGDFMTAEEISRLVDGWTEYKVRQTCVGSELIGSFGRKNRKTLYGLKAWELEKGVSSGSMFQLCLSHLENSKRPLHFYELWVYLHGLGRAPESPLDISKNLRGLIRGEHNQILECGNGYFGIRGRHDDGIERAKIVGSDMQVIMDCIRMEGRCTLTAFIDKVSQPLELAAEQVRYLLFRAEECGYARVEAGIVYYGRVDESSIVERLFAGVSNCKVRERLKGYDIELKNGEYFLQCDVVNSVLVERVFDFDYYSLKRIIREPKRVGLVKLVYHRSRKLFCVRLHSTLGHDNEKYKGGELEFKEGIEYAERKIGDSEMMYWFSWEGAHRFAYALETLNLARAGSGLELRQLDISGLSEMEAICHIIETAEALNQGSMTLVEARAIYQQILAASQSH